VRYRVADEFGGDYFDVLGEVAEFVVAQCGPDVETRHCCRVRVPGSVNATSDVDSSAAIAIMIAFPSHCVLAACTPGNAFGRHCAASGHLLSCLAKS
jgi:hypothetical protein